MKHSELALRRPITTIMIFLALGAVGLISTRLLPLEKFPDIQFPGIFIQIPYPGSTPEEVERRITRPVEEAIATLSGIERMQSTSRQDGVEMFVQFGWDQDVSVAGIDARAKIDSIREELPGDLERIQVFTGSLGDQPILNLRISSERDLSDAHDLLDRQLKRRIERIDGVSKVDLYGVEPREIRILMDADRVAAHSVNLNDVRERLEKSNFAVSAGKISEAQQRFNVRPLGEFDSLRDIEDLAINADGLRIRDIATVSLRSPDRNYGRHLNRSYAIGLDVFKQTGANMVEVADRVTAEVERIGETPQMQGINIFALQNQADGVKNSLSDLLRSGLIGAILAIGVLYLFLRQFITTLIVTLAVPFSMLITLGAMYFFGLSLNILSMMGLMLAIGMLVDNAVVVTESIFRERQLDPENPDRATIAGVEEVGLAVIAGTATSIIVFLPVMFGEKIDITVFLTHVAITIVVALIASLVIAQTLVPMLAARIAQPPAPVTGSLMERLNDKYAAALRWTLNHRAWTAAGIVLILASGALPMQFINFDTFPQESSRRLFMPYHIEGTHSLERVESVVDKVEEFLFSKRDELDIVAVYSYFDLGRAESTILLRDEDEATVPTDAVIKQIEEGLPEIIIGKPSFQFEQTGGSEGFSLQISGESTERLAEISADLVRVLGSVEGLVDLRSDSGDGEQEVRVVVDRERAAPAGLTTQQVAMTIATAMRGSELREFRGETGEVDVRLAFRASDRETIEELAGLPLYNDRGDRIQLGSIADFHLHQGPRSIQRVNRATAAVISANLDDVSLDEIQPRIKALMEDYRLPAGYSWSFGRGFDSNDETQQMMGVNILLGIVMIYLVMAALFESVLYPISIITSIAFSIIGVFWFFWLTGTTFSFMASIGIMILIGIVVNNGIVLVDHINNLRSAGMPRNEAIVLGGRDRLRPILMTVATTILGLVPLSIGTTQIGGDGPPYFPMARAIIGGLAFSTITSLLVVPSIYMWFDGLSRWGRKVMRVSRGDSAAVPERRRAGA